MSVVDIAAVLDWAHEDDVPRMVARYHAVTIDGQTIAALEGRDGYVLAYLVLVTFEADAVPGAYAEVEHGDDAGAILGVGCTEEVTADGIRDLVKVEG